MGEHAIKPSSASHVVRWVFILCYHPESLDYSSLEAAALFEVLYLGLSSQGTKASFFPVHKLALNFPGVVLPCVIKVSPVLLLSFRK